MLPAGQDEYDFFCLGTPFCLSNISAPKISTEMFLYSKFAYGSQFSGEKNDLSIRSLVIEILSKQGG